MCYRQELQFMKNIFQKMNLQILEYKENTHPSSLVDFGIRRFFGLEKEYESTFLITPFTGNQKKIYKLTDSFHCNYLHLLLPEENGSVLLIGPYISAQFTYEDLLHEAERLSIPPNQLSEMENYYGNIPVLKDDSFLFSIINAFAEVLWGSSKSYTIMNLKEDEISPNPIPSMEDYIPMDKTLLTMENMEKRYAYENEILNAVTLGLAHKAEMMLSTFSEMALKLRVSDPIRNAKNYCIIMNTLMRKSAEQASIHPIYLDAVSSTFARKIELIGSVSSAYKLMKEMISNYCRLVNKYSMIKYSLPIRKTLVCIESNLIGDLSLNSLASLQNISSGYLSALFRKETGQTLTEYVNIRRIKHAEYLLRSTALQIQTIAQFCGIPDANYFTKTFKRYSGSTPEEYRRTRRNSNESKDS
ncbi:helix-turn-helix domain-containing protein [Alloiococcus sp. CFN-8]|uniref:helix-turn-helix domain-containing protein n=1 Tax=Alloiococcus sp. CFN-8 TaxID=3416081 RepID=UPI003CEDE1B6